MTTITRRIAAARRGPRRPRIYFSSSLLGLMLIAALVIPGFVGGNGLQGALPDLSLNTAGVTCANAQGTSNEFSRAVQSVNLATPDYTGIKSFGFAAPLYPSDIAPLKELLQTRLDQVDAKAKTASDGACTDSPTASVIDANGQSVTLPLVDGSQPDSPLSGSQANVDPRTVPVTVGTTGNKVRTNTWSELNDLYGKTDWYTKCSDTKLSMNWDKDVPTYTAAEGSHDNRFILAINVSSTLTDDQIRAKATADGNPNTDKLKVVRVNSIINTRNLEENRCDDFIHTQSQIRVSLAKPIFNADGSFKELDTSEGIFVDCHNMWRLPKSKPVPTPTPTPPGHPTSTPPGTPTTTPPTTQPPTCTNGGTPPKCLEAKDPNAGAGHKGNVPTQVQGTNPPAGKTSEPRPSDPPKTYVPPAPPPDTHPAPTRTSTPPVETPAPKPSDPATGCVPPPGTSHC